MGKGAVRLPNIIVLTHAVVGAGKETMPKPGGQERCQEIASGQPNASLCASFQHEHSPASAAMPGWRALERSHAICHHVAAPLQHARVVSSCAGHRSPSVRTREGMLCRAAF